MPTLAEQLTALAQGALAAHGLVLVQARLSGGTASGRGKQTLDVMAEMPDGSSPTVELCTAASRTLSAQMDVADYIKTPYTLEVGSSGLERPLLNPADYTRFNGKQAKLTFTRPIPNPSGKGVLGSTVGVITKPTEGTVTVIMAEGGFSLTVNYSQIHHANLTPSTEELAALMKQATDRQKAAKLAAESAEDVTAEVTE